MIVLSEVKSYVLGNEWLVRRCLGGQSTGKTTTHELIAGRT